jgi:hypothetical protein
MVSKLTLYLAQSPCFTTFTECFNSRPNGNRTQFTFDRPFAGGADEFPIYMQLHVSIDIVST